MQGKEGTPETAAMGFVQHPSGPILLVVPTFTHSGTEYFDPRVSPSKNGAALCQVMKGQDVIDATVEILRPILTPKS